MAPRVTGGQRGAVRLCPPPKPSKPTVSVHLPEPHVRFYSSPSLENQARKLTFHSSQNCTPLRGRNGERARVIDRLGYPRRLGRWPSAKNQPSLQGPARVICWVFALASICQEGAGSALPGDPERSSPASPTLPVACRSGVPGHRCIFIDQQGGAQSHPRGRPPGLGKAPPKQRSRRAAGLLRGRKAPGWVIETTCAGGLRQLGADTRDWRRAAADVASRISFVPWVSS